MSAFIDENTQFVNSNGKPIVNGKLYVGTKGLDPILNPITIYSDRELTTVLANPQILDADGRSTNKIWIPGEYSFRVDNTNDVQQLIDLDAGTIPTVGVTILSDVQGVNTITATATPTITSYSDGQTYVFQPASTNTGAATLNIDNIGAIDIKLFGGALSGGELVADVNMTVAYNSSSNSFDLLVATSKGANILSSAAGTNTITANGSPSITSYIDGQIYILQTANTNTGAATLNIDGAGAAPIELEGNPLTGAELLSGINALLIYNSDESAFDLIGAIGSSLYLTEKSAASAATAGRGQLWVKDTTPNTLIFSNDEGDDQRIGITIGTEQSTTSGTAIDFTIPSGVKRVTVMLEGFSTNSTSTPIIQLGDAGGLETTGYSSTADASSATAQSTIGYLLSPSHTASHELSGAFVLSLEDIAGFTWVSHHSLRPGGGSNVRHGAGVKSLSAELTSLRLTTTNGSDTFTAGNVNISYE